MKTRDEIIEQFDLNPDDEDQERILKRLIWIQRAGKVDGATKRYADGDFDSDRHWRAGIGKHIKDAEESLGVDDDSVFDLYNDAHSEALKSDEDIDETLERDEDSEEHED